MNIFYIFYYLIILFLPGETIFQLSFLKKKERILQFSIIEHLIYVIIIGLCFSSTVCLFLAIFQQLNLLFLILIDLGVFIISFFLNNFNKKSINDNILIFRIIEYFKSRETISFKKIIKNYYVTIFSAVIFFVIYLLMLMTFKYIPNHDIWYFTQWAIDIVKHNPNILYSQENVDLYLGEILYINFQNYYLAIFLLFDIELWEFLIHYILPLIPLICLFLLIINFTSYRRDHKKYIPIILLFSSYYLLNWFFYASPVIFSIIIGLLLINSIFDKKKRSVLLIIILGFYMYLFHTITTGLFAISFFFTFIFLLLINFKNKEKRKEYKDFIKSKIKLIIFLILIFSTMVILILIIFSTQIFVFLNKYIGDLYNFQERAFSPNILDWFFGNVGIFILLISILTMYFIYSNTQNKKIGSLKNFEIPQSKINVLFFFWYLLVEMVIICLFLPYWYFLTGIPYLYYRYFIYLDLSCIILAPFGFRFIIKHIQNLKIEKKRISQYLKIFKLSFFISIVIMTGIHFIYKYNLGTHFSYVPEEHIDTYFWLKTNTPSNSVYFVSPYTNSSTVYMHCVLDDRIFINQSLGWEIFNDSLYINGDNDNFNIFIEYNFKKSKPIDKRWAYSQSFPENYTDKKVDYIIIDDYYNHYLTNRLLHNKTCFEVIKSTFNYDHLIRRTYMIYVFRTKNY